LTDDEKETRIKGRFASLLGLVYKGYNPMHHRIPRHDIKSTWGMWMHIDYHPRKPHAALWVAVRPDGIKVVCGELRNSDPGNRIKEFAQELLELEGFSTKIATSGEEALKILNEAVPAMIFLDIVMPGMDGFQVARRLQSKPEWRKIPVVILSGKELTDKEREMFQSHIKEVMNKEEFDKEAIASTIKRILTSA